MLFRNTETVSREQGFDGTQTECRSRCRWVRRQMVEREAGRGSAFASTRRLRSSAFCPSDATRRSVRGEKLVVGVTRYRISGGSAASSCSEVSASSSFVTLHSPSALSRMQTARCHWRDLKLLVSDAQAAQEISITSTRRLLPKTGQIYPPATGPPLSPRHRKLAAILTRSLPDPACANHQQPSPLPCTSSSPST